MLSYDQSHHLHDFVTPPPIRRTASMTSFTYTASDSSESPTPKHRRIWIITGPAGCGKTTVAKYVAKQFCLPYIEGDEFHPPANVEKMAAGIPLTDSDRWDWLISLRKESVAALNTGAPAVVLTCSALKRKYRDVIRIASYDNHDVLVHFIYLHASEQTLLARVRARQGHYMKDSMVKSQVMSLEEPTADEKDVSYIEVGGSVAEVERLAVATIRELIARESNIGDGEPNAKY